MCPVKWLNNILFIENLFGIYRNYCYQKKIKKFFIIIQIFIQTMLHAIMLITELYLLLGIDYELYLIFGSLTALASMNSMSFIVTGACYSRAFMSYFRSISRIFEFFKNDKKLIISLKKMFCFTLSFHLFFFALCVTISVVNIRKLSHSDPFIYLILSLVSVAMIRFTILFQHLMLYMVTMIVVNLFKCLNSLISVVQQSVGSCDVSSGEQCDIITREQIQGWVELYRDLANCCEKLTLCFGRQYFFSLALSILQYILLAYQICYTNVSKIEITQDYTRIVIIIHFISVMILPLIAVQMASNQGMKFHRILVRLYNTMIIDSGKTEVKLIKDLIRLIKKNPLEIKLLSKVPAGMYMVPVILTLAVNYLIVMLQFSHII